MPHQISADERENQGTPNPTTVPELCREISGLLQIPPQEVDLYARRLREMYMLPQSVGRRYPAVSFEQAALLVIALLASPNARQAADRAREYAALTLEGGDSDWSMSLLDLVTGFLKECDSDEDKHRQVDRSRIIIDRNFPIAYFEREDGTRSVFQGRGTEGKSPRRRLVYADTWIRGAYLVMLSMHLNAGVEAGWAAEGMSQEKI